MGLIVVDTVDTDDMAEVRPLINFLCAMKLLLWVIL